MGYQKYLLACQKSIQRVCQLVLDSGGRHPNGWYCPAHLQVHSNHLYGKLGAYYLETEIIENITWLYPYRQSVWGLRTRQRACTVTCTQTSNYLQSRSHCPLRICSYSFSSEHIYLATDILAPPPCPKSNDTASRNWPLIAITCDEVQISPDSVQVSRTVYSVTCPNLQLSKEGFQTVLLSGRIILKEGERRFPLECKGGEGGTEMNEWGQARMKGKSRSWGNTPEEKWHSRSPPEVSVWSQQFPENGRLWSSSWQAQDSEMQVKSSLFKQNVNL